jgi:hypothetical protein
MLTSAVVSSLKLTYASMKPLISAVPRLGLPIRDRPPAALVVDGREKKEDALDGLSVGGAKW